MDANNCDDLTQSSDTATEGDDLPALNYKNVLLVMEQLSVGCDGTNVLQFPKKITMFNRNQRCVCMQEDTTEVLTHFLIAK